MRCIGRNKNFKRCKNKTGIYPFCSHHRWQIIILLFISVPTLLGTYSGIYRDLIVPFSEQHEVKLDFYNSNNPIFKVVNTTKSITENVLISFGIKDIDRPGEDFLPIKSFELSHINPSTEKGPWKVLGNYGKSNHRYFGIMYLSCKGCEELKTYWIYIDRKSGDSFYSLRQPSDTWTIHPDSLRIFPEYLEHLVPSGRRTRIEYR